MVSCQRCRQPLAPSWFPPLPSSSSSPHHRNPHSHSHSQPHPALDDSVAALSPSTYDYDFLSASERLPHPPPTSSSAASPSPSSHLYRAATRQPATPVHRLTVPPSLHSHHHPALHSQAGQRRVGPTDSFVVLTDSVLHPAHPSDPSPFPSTDPSSTFSSSSSSAHPTSSSNSDDPSPLGLNPKLSQLAYLASLLSSTSSIDHPLCTDCTDVLLELMHRELDDAKKERDRLVGFEKEVLKRREENKREGKDAPTREGLEKEVAKIKKAELHSIAELKAVEARKVALQAEAATLDAEEAELAREEAEFWTAHSSYLFKRDALLDRSSALTQRLASGQKELDKLQRTNVYNDAFCIGQEAGFGTINGLRLGRLPGVQVDWPEINAAWGQTLLLLHTISRKFGFGPERLKGWKLVPCGSFSRIERLPGSGEAGRGESLELYGSSDFAVTRLLQNRRFDMAMVAFLDCLRQLIEWVVGRDRGVRVPHAIVKDRIGDVSIKFQFGSEETWTRALRHVLLDLKILLGRASL